jgi:hypothetical protein
MGATLSNSTNFTGSYCNEDTAFGESGQNAFALTITFIIPDLLPVAVAFDVLKGWKVVSPSGASLGCCFPVQPGDPGGVDLFIPIPTDCMP